MEYKAIELETKEIAEDGRTVTGFAAVIGNIDGGADRIWKGAFKKTLRDNGKRVKHLWQHSPDQPPIAVIRNLKEVGVEELPESIRGEYPEAKGGLMVTREYLDTPRGNEILAGVRSGAITEMSFAYDPIRFDFEEVDTEDGKMMVRNLKEVRLWETSDVVWGMNPATVASKAEDFKLAQLEELLTSLKAGRVLSARNLSRLKDALTVLNDILLAAEPPGDDEAEKARVAQLALTEQILFRLAIAERELV
jgi:HK97 family phage prohead protease